MSRKYHAAIAKKVAKEWGVEAPFPTKHIARRWHTYLWHIDMIDANRRDIEEGCDVAGSKRNIAKHMKQRDRLKVPLPYVSWEHIAAFHNTFLDREEHAALYD